MALTDLTDEQVRVLESFAKEWEKHLQPESEVDALALLFVWLGRRPQKDLWNQAVAVDYLVKRLGGRQAVAKAVGASYSSIKSRHTILELPACIKMMFA